MSLFVPSDHIPGTHYDIRVISLPLLLRALGDGNACFVLGAGASAPDAPLTRDIPSRIKGFLTDVGSFPVSQLPEGPLRQLLPRPRRGPRGFEDWKIGQFTGATVAVALQQMMHPRPRPCPPQYTVFRTFSLNACIVSFNWDGLAEDCCPQSRILHPHGRIYMKLLDERGRHEMFSLAQSFADSDGREFLPERVVLPGEEAGPMTEAARALVMRVWRSSSCIVSIGYAFGIGCNYDHVWRELFVGAMRGNRAALHFVGPNAGELVREVSEAIERRLCVYAWPFRWDGLSRALLHLVRYHRYHSVTQLVPHSVEVLRTYERVTERL